MTPNPKGLVTAVCAGSHRVALPLVLRIALHATASHISVAGIGLATGLTLWRSVARAQRAVVTLALLMVCSLQAALGAPGGLNVIPTADIYEPGTASLELQTDGATRLFGRGCSRFLLTQFGVLRNLELGLDHSLHDSSGTPLLNAKYRVLEGEARRPMLALGLQNVASGATAQPYLVAGWGQGRPVRLHTGVIALDGKARAMVGTDATLGPLTFQADWVSGRGNWATLGVSCALQPNVTLTYAAGLPRFLGGRLPHMLNVQYLLKLR